MDSPIINKGRVCMYPLEKMLNPMLLQDDLDKEFIDIAHDSQFTPAHLENGIA
jgi:hypothetical protein